MSSKEKRARLDALLALKGGKRKDYEAEGSTDIYDEVTDADYRAIVKGRLEEEDFIEDDDGSGYVDQGVDDWERVRSSEEESSDVESKYRNPKKSKKQPTTAATTAKSKAPAALLKKKPVLRKANGDSAVSASGDSSLDGAANGISDYRKPKAAVSTVDDSSFMDSLLGGLDSAAVSVPATRPSLASRKRKSSPDFDFNHASTIGQAHRPRKSYASSSSIGSDPIFDHNHDADADGDGGISSDGGLEVSDSGGKGKAREVKKARMSGVEAPMADMDVGPTFDVDLNGAGMDLDDDDLPDAGSATALKKVKTEEDDDDDVFVVKAQTRGPAAGQRNRTLVNAASVKVRPSLPGGNEDKKPAVKNPKAKGMDWRLAMENLVGPSDDAKPSIGTDSEPDMSGFTDPEDVKEAPEQGEHYLANLPRKISAAEARRKAKAEAEKELPKPMKVSAFEGGVKEEGSHLRFFWLDYLEVNGVVHLFGKVWDKTGSGKWVSCCVTVKGIERNLYFLPRESFVDEDDEVQVPTEDDVYDEVEDVLKSHNISEFRAKEVARKYAFEIKDVPAESTKWQKVVYGFDQPVLPMNLKGRTYSRVFGTNTSAFELFVLKRKIIGPCWLDVKGAVPPVLGKNGKNISWCKLELVVNDPKNVNPCSDSDPTAPKDVPPLTIMSMSVRDIVNHKENKREIVAVTLRTWKDSNLDDTTPIEKQRPMTTQTFVRPLGEFPQGFEAAVKAKHFDKSQPAPISTFKDEAGLLTRMLGVVTHTDPDVLVGHELATNTLDVLLHRMRELKTPFLSRIGRYRRDRAPVKQRAGFNNQYCTGRLVCDLSSDGSRSMIASTTWSLTEMCSTHLKISREDIDPDDTIEYFDASAASSNKLVHFIEHCAADSMFQMMIAYNTQILPLTKQLTNLAGNSWNATLGAGRAQRNEYILLHEFHRQKYICPDKLSFADRQNAKALAEAEAGEDGEGGKKSGGKKDKYKGGLVFEPKRGLWDRFILVMDFNSLYPSIIQEYNIDFTTVDRSGDHSADINWLPEIPDSAVKQGVLPRLIATLVNRRRQVKSLMKDRDVTPAKLMQYDIKQMALKLTANSMYGCLGFEGSRFYAPSLAALTTSKGREILTNTKELAESKQLDVVYGDTDSVMINTNAIELDLAKQVGNDFKKLVNERYRLLEIDTDAIFQRMLLLQKKKYAALKIDDNGTSSVEVKGLDMKRREYCKLSKDASQYILNQILSGDATEVVVEKIHDFLTELGQKVKNGEMDLEDYIVYKRLGKNPKEYPDAKAQPHVQVALRMLSKGGSAKAGDVIPYIFSLGADGVASKTAQADKARHPDDFRRLDSAFKIDYDMYLSTQVLPPIERLCDPIEGIDRARLAECLGLDPARFQSATTNGPGHDREFHTLDSQIPDFVRFKDAAPLSIRCRHCNHTFETRNLQEAPTNLTPTGLVCPNASCGLALGNASIAVQLETQIRGHINRFYEGWLVCDDASCGNRTRMMSVYGSKCLKTDINCRGNMRFEFTDGALYNQLLFYDTIFDRTKMLAKAQGTAKHDDVRALLEQNSGALDQLHATTSRHLERNGRRYVGMAGLFSFMTVS